MTTRCSSAGCGLDARWQLTVDVWAHGKQGAPLSLQLDLVACDYHMQHPGEALDLFPVEQQAIISAALVQGGRARPDFSTAAWHFIAITPEAAAAIVRGELRETSIVRGDGRKVTLQ